MWLAKDQLQLSDWQSGRSLARHECFPIGWYEADELDYVNGWVSGFDAEVRVNWGDAFGPILDRRNLARIRFHSHELDVVITFYPSWNTDQGV